MFKVLIVEDEMLVRLGIRSSIDWSKFDMYVVADVENGQVAWEVYKKNKPDLILTDIKMPVMDGIQLIEKIRKEDSETKFIILSCHEEFKFARKAFLLGVSDYILKLTMTQVEMESVLGKVRNELVKSNLQKSGGNDMIKTLNISKDNIISDFLFYGIYSESKLADILNELNLSINPERLILCIMEIDHYYLLQKKFKDEKGKLIRFSILNIVNEVLSGYKRGIMCHEKDRRFIIIMSFHDKADRQEIEAELLDILEHIRRVLKTYFDTCVTIGISSIKNGYSMIKNMYDECSDIIGYKYYTGNGKNIRSSDIDLNFLKESIRSKLKQCFDKYDILSPESCIDENSFPISREETLKMFLEWGHKALVLTNHNVNNISGVTLNYAQQIENSETLDETIEVFKEYLSQISNIKTGKKCCSKEIANAIKYIRVHYDENISLQQIAEVVELSPNYLSSLFKREFEKSLFEYVTEVRIEKAKKLLLNTNLKLYEVAEKVGFSDVGYFSRTFKKISGINPSDYKKQWM